MYGVIDINKIKHTFITYRSDIGDNMMLTLSEVYECDKDGKLFDETIDTEYNFSLGGSDEKEIIKQLLEKCVIALNNPCVIRENKGIDDYAKETGSMEICEDNFELYFKIDGEKYKASDAIELFRAYCGFTMQYQIRDKNDELIEDDMILMPLKINEGTLISELKNIVFAVSDNHNSTFISYENVSAFDVLFIKLLDKLKFYSRIIGKEVGDKLIQVLKNIGSDDDMFTEYEIKMVRDAVKDIWD